MAARRWQDTGGCCVLWMQSFLHLASKSHVPMRMPPAHAGGSDACVAIWEDATASEAAAREEAEERLVEQEQELANALAVGRARHELWEE